MNIKTFYFFLLSVICNASFFGQQNTIVEYNYQFFDGGEPTSEKQYLIIGRDKTFYFTYNATLDSLKFNEDFILKKGFNLKFISNNSLIEYKTSLPQKRALVSDSLPNFNWKILNDTKIILGYNCQKASIVFRGRKYDVYFTKDIPIDKGPWKFNSLPGLILEVSDQNKFFKFEATKIFLNSKIPIPPLLEDFFEKYKNNIIPYKRFIEEENKYLLYLHEMIKANSAPGAIYDNINLREYCIEKTFEWN
ncbi:GLPGLI family protein [Chryseobacterium oryzae]|uniref:GLPGLI family protein n=1 Tax=Chryseobacterium oryzae TaxID=2929799 RepID=A0ABY4BJK9_9FLAO|nr:GLPGLI family protein [Chryseobacterium oryzae]UOE39383.1 GLPGLI family protein [Chryseobacterium oryzae]